MMAFLSGVSPFPSVEHEPFNIDRVWGHVTRGPTCSADQAQVMSAVKECVAERPNIKHCIEIIPGTITRALIEECTERNYGILVLTRRDEQARLASLLLAQATGVFGPAEAARIYPEIRAGRVQPKAIALEKIVGRINTDAAAVGNALSILRNRGIAYEWLVFEELYADASSIATHAQRIAHRLGLDVKPDDPRLAAFSRQSGQQSTQIEQYVPGMARAREILAEHVVR